MKGKKLNLSAPWYEWRNECAKLFELDDAAEVGEVEERDGGYFMTVRFGNHAKAAAWERILPKKVEFGGAVLNVVIEDAGDDEDLLETLKTAFAGNRIVRKVVRDDGIVGGERIFVVFESYVVQFFNDNLADYRRNFTALAADAARNVFTGGNETFQATVSFCTAAENEND